MQESTSPYLPPLLSLSNLLPLFFFLPLPLFSSSHKKEILLYSHISEKIVFLTHEYHFYSPLPLHKNDSQPVTNLPETEPPLKSFEDCNSQ